ncbi:conserved Plasmodium protein, unknown function [Plasmodium chabaudi chabaudi]|uniref:Fam-c protein n=1 Tax=Plasmodium chabaudi chabaudi TaxID=31271 RepID=A0A1C6X878_PLACU|nr:conserved Plasmodium protein, unknown function [Plasmodium chabaudi chabaudi]
MNVLCISFFLFCIFHFYKTASINEVSKASEVAQILVDISDQIEKTAINTPNPENGPNGDSKLLENKDSDSAKYHDLLPQNNPNITKKKTDRRYDNNYEQSSDKKEDFNKTDHKQDISAKPSPQNDSDKPTDSKELNELQKNRNKVTDHEYSKNVDGKPIKSKRKHMRKGRKNRTAKDLNKNDIEKAKIGSTDDKKEENGNHNQSIDEPLDLSMKKI